MKPFRYSSIQDFYKCPRYYKYKHIDGLIDPGMEKSADMRFGSAMHLGVQDLLEGGNGLDVFTTWWQLEEKNDLEYTRLKHADLGRMGVDLLIVFRDEHMHKFVPKYLEMKLATALGPHAYSGTADFVGEYKGVPSVVDWKTSAMPYGPQKIEVNEQMYGYAHLVKQELGYEAEQVVYGVAVKDPKNPRWQFRTAPISNTIVSKKLDNVIQACDSISSTKVFMKNPLQCATGSYGNIRVCPFYKLCHNQDGEIGNEEGEEARVAELQHSGAKASK